MTTSKNFTQVLDEYDFKILLLLKDGIKTKNLPEYIPLSLGTINHRKANLKIVFNIESGDDCEIVKKSPRFRSALMLLTYK